MVCGQEGGEDGKRNKRERDEGGEGGEEAIEIEERKHFPGRFMAPWAAEYIYIYVARKFFEL